MYIVYYGGNNREFVVQTDNPNAVCEKAQAQGYEIKDIIRR